MIFILFFIYGIYAAATEGITKAWITNMAHDTNTATAIGFYTSCESVCSITGQYYCGSNMEWCRKFLYFYNYSFCLNHCNPVFLHKSYAQVIFILFFGTKMVFHIPLAEYC